MFMGFGLILTIGAVAAIVYALGWRPGGHSSSFSPARSNRSPLDIARERYAQGEIDRDEYNRIREDLGN